MRDRYLRALTRGDETEATDAIQEAVSFHWPPATLYIDVLASAMTKIGDMWHAGEISIAHEHQATQVTLRQAALLRQFFPPERKTGLHAIVSAVERNGHTLGAMIFSDLIYFEGWDTDFLGSGTPPDALGQMVAERKPDLVALSATQPGGIELLRDCIQAVRKAHKDAFVIVGGPVTSQKDSATGQLGADLVATDPMEAIEEIRTRFEVAGTSISLEHLLQRVGEQVKSRRLAKGWSQQHLAQLASLDRTYLSGVENGKQNLTLGAVKKLADALGSPIPDFLS